MRQPLRILFAVAFCLLLVGGVGCTRSRKTRVRASGTVTAAGRPLSVGRITFRPSGGGQSYSDAIHDGRYSIRSRYAVPAGQYDVTINFPSGGGRGFDRQHTERVTLAPLGPRRIDFHLN